MMITIKDISRCQQYIAANGLVFKNKSCHSSAAENKELCLFYYIDFHFFLKRHAISYIYTLLLSVKCLRASFRESIPIIEKEPSLVVVVYHASASKYIYFYNKVRIYIVQPKALEQTKEVCI